MQLKHCLQKVKLKDELRRRGVVEVDQRNISTAELKSKLTKILRGNISRHFQSATHCKADTLSVSAGLKVMPLNELMVAGTANES